MHAYIHCVLLIKHYLCLSLPSSSKHIRCIQSPTFSFYGHPVSFPLFLKEANLITYHFPQQDKGKLYTSWYKQQAGISLCPITPTASSNAMHDAAYERIHTPTPNHIHNPGCGIIILCANVTGLLYIYGMCAQMRIVVNISVGRVSFV